ncbi:endoribonuclease ZC3H12A isoform X2 [Stigmatopora argus]
MVAKSKLRWPACKQGKGVGGERRCSLQLYCTLTQSGVLSHSRTSKAKSPLTRQASQSMVDVTRFFHSWKEFQISPSMDSLSSNRSSASPESSEHQLQADFFRKLGYSSVEVNAALSKLGQGTDTNSVLEELVQSRGVALGSSQERSANAQEDSSRAQGFRTATQLQSKKGTQSELRPIVIDGRNVAMSHGNKEVFSCQGIQLAVDFFRQRGHGNITVFVPSWRKGQSRPDAVTEDQYILTELEKQKVIVFTPSRRVSGKLVVCYDDRFIVKLAYETDGVIVSNDTYRDLQGERAEWKKCIEERLLMYSFVNDKFMPPDDPLGRHGPNLDNFLRIKALPKEQNKQLCPYDKRCTYGMKCKFYHPERANQSSLSLADELREKAQISPPKANAHSSLPPSRSLPHPRHQEVELFDRQWASHPAQASQNQIIYWEGPNPATVNCSRSTRYHCTGPHEYLDSGLGSFESPYSNICAGSGHCRCCHGSYNPAGPSPNPTQNRSVPSPLNVAPQYFPNYWSDPFHGSRRVEKCHSLPCPTHSSFGSSHSGEQFDPQRRQEVRKNLQAIFSPQQVDAVMDMYPHMMSAEKLAAEILNQRAQNAIFL